MIGGDTGLRGGIDIFSGPPQPIGGSVKKGGEEEAGGREGGGERTKMPGDSEGGQQSGTYTMYDEQGDPGKPGAGFDLAFLFEGQVLYPPPPTLVGLEVRGRHSYWGWTPISLYPQPPPPPPHYSLVHLCPRDEVKGGRSPGIAMMFRYSDFHVPGRLSL